MRVFEDRVPKRIFGIQREKERMEKLSNEKLQTLCLHSIFVTTPESRNSGARADVHC
jgi:hypothetical protein